MTSLFDDEKETVLPYFAVMLKLSGLVISFMFSLVIYERFDSISAKSIFTDLESSNA